MRSVYKKHLTYHVNKSLGQERQRFFMKLVYL